MTYLGLADATTLGPADINPDAIDLSTPSAGAITIQQKSIQLWHVLLAGAITGFAMALGDVALRRGIRRFNRRS